MRSMMVTWVALLAMAAVVLATPAPLCLLNTSLGFVVDTSVSTDPVAKTMKAALQKVGDYNGAVLSFQHYYLSTWNFTADDVKSYNTIEELTDDFVSEGVGNIRLNVQPPGAHDDWAYMIQSLYAQVLLASDNGMIVVLGDEDELCDGRIYDPLPTGGCHWFCGRFNNTDYNLLAAQVQQIAQAKNVQISFYYFIKPDQDPNNPQTQDPNGCTTDVKKPGNRKAPMDMVTGWASATGGKAVFDSSDAVSDAMALDIKLAGKVPAVCPGCAEDSTFALLVDTSADLKTPVMNLLNQLYAAYNAHTLQPFKNYEFISWGSEGVKSFDTFPDMVAGIKPATNPGLYEDKMKAAAGQDPAQIGNDWLYLINNLKDLIGHVGVGGYIVVMDDEEAFCDTQKYKGDPRGSKVWAYELQQVINAAVAKKIQLVWYQFTSPADPTACGSDAAKAMIHIAEGRADATAVILAGEDQLHLDPTNANVLQPFVLSIVEQSQRLPCRNCTLNAQLGFIVDTSDSAQPLKDHHYKKWFEQLTTLGTPSPLASFTGGFDLNTWHEQFDVVIHVPTVDALNIVVQASPLTSDRYQDDPAHDHDDWKYMLDNLPYMVKKVGENGIVVILADDNQICDAGKFVHNTSEPNYVAAIQYAQEKHIAISYFQFPTENRWCEDAGMTKGRNLAAQIASSTGGSAYFPMVADTAATVDQFFTEHVVQGVLLPAGARPVCPETCPAGSVWVGDHCLKLNACDPSPCANGQQCIPDLVTATYTCNCSEQYYGEKCEFHCVDHSTLTSLSHAVALVVDTSDSTGITLTGVATALSSMLAANGSFDKYFLSTWAYTKANNGGVLHKSFATAQQVADELDAVKHLKHPNHRIDGDATEAVHDDWRYMIESVESLMPSAVTGDDKDWFLGDNAVVIILTDLEGVCDANPAVRLSLQHSGSRYPDNPLDGRIAKLNAAALAHHAQVFFFAFPSSDQNFGYCNKQQKSVAADAAGALIDKTDGVVEQFAEYDSAHNRAIVTDVLSTLMVSKATAKRCECDAGMIVSPTDKNYCVPESP